jgi:hypothetical protein
MDIRNVRQILGEKLSSYFKIRNGNLHLEDRKGETVFFAGERKDGTIGVDFSTGSGAVTKITAGANVTISPLSGVGNVTIAATSGSSFDQSLNTTDNVEFNSVKENGVLISDKYVNVAGDTMTGDLVGTDFVSTRSGTINRTNNFVSSIIKTGGRTLTFVRNAQNFVISKTDGTRTWTYTRDVNNHILSWTVI